MLTGRKRQWSVVVDRESGSTPEPSHADVAQLVALLTCTQGVVGSTPSVSFMRRCRFCQCEFEPHRDSYGYYCSNACQQEYQYAKWVAKVERTGRFSSSQQMKRPKRYLYEKQRGACAVCGRKTWLGKPILLIFDHIDGNHRNNRIVNCRMVCSNCDATLPTYKNRNIGAGRHARRERYQQGKSY